MPASIIAVSGKSGCGNTTVSRLVAQKLGRRFINYTFRTMAQERNMSLESVLQAAETDPSWDRALDARQVELAREADCVIGSRLALWMLPEARLKVYLKAGLETRSRRIQAREGGSLEKVEADTQSRDLRDRKRYRDIYGIDTDDLSSADLVIDTELWSADDIASIIVGAFSSSKALR